MSEKENIAFAMEMIFGYGIDKDSVSDSLNISIRHLEQITDHIMTFRNRMDNINNRIIHLESKINHEQT